ncbi:hypothetical protein ABW19_dt0202684 [Dactylella cylindrospora]|nr:hypothetical protein ABW19_dt0202684 [Dactylella cylindrospora]
MGMALYLPTCRFSEQDMVSLLDYCLDYQRPVANRLRLLASSRSSFSMIPTFGFRGEFLSSLATSSLLTIYSRSKLHRSTHAVRYHYGSRLICGQVENDSLTLRNSGTKVLVDRLFGNFPVRIMGRENMTAVELNKEWREIGRNIVEVLLLINRPVKVVIRDEKAVKRAGFDLTGDDLGKERWSKVLEQAGYPRVPWESVEADWNGINLQGMMGLTPLADTEKQYIFLNGSPISKNSNSILYSKINSLFAASVFGMIDEATPPEDGKRLVVRKGIEKHPSFVIFVHTGAATVHTEDLEVDSGNSILIDVARLLESVVDEFLRVGGWKRKVTPRKRLDEDVEMTVDSVPVRYDAIRTDNLLDATVSSKFKSSSAIRSKRLNDGSTEPPTKRTRRSPQTADIDEPDTITYLDPVTNTAVLLDSQTGNQFKAASQPAGSRNRISLIPTDIGASSKASAWASSFLSSFKNPVYGVPEATIPTSATPTDDLLANKNGGLSKISKSSIAKARVVSQVDDKYILLLLHAPELLVIVDQHAADERVRVERLWREYDNTPKTLKKPVNFTIAADEWNTMLPHLQGIREWGFEFEATAIREGARIDLVGVPELVADRCVSEPLLAVSLIRTWIAELKEGGVFRRFSPEGDWIKTMVSATKGLSEVVSSRACRSAIMFNDKLSQEECQGLISMLAVCDFPFQCAHGRPSMVPLIDLADGGVEQRFNGDGCHCTHPSFGS